MKKSEALKEIEGLVKNYEEDLAKLTKVLPKTVKHKHMFNDINYCIRNVQDNIDMLNELKREIEESGKKDEDKIEAFKYMQVPSFVDEIKYDFEWDDEDKEEKEDKE